MNGHNDPIAFIGERLRLSRTDIEADYEVTRVLGEDRGLVLIDGTEKAFQIITRPEQMRGRWYSDAKVLPHAGRMPVARRSEFMRYCAIRVREQ